MNPLDGLRVVVTRPEPYAQALSEALEAQGAQVLTLPTIQIKPVPCSIPSEIPTDIIFTSQAAVQNAPALPKQANIYAIGPATAAALKEQGVDKVITQPAGNDSADLLSSANLASPLGRTFWLVTGRHGRRLLEQELLAKGGQITRLEVYERRCPSPIGQAQQRSFQLAHAVVITSVDAFRHLVHMAGPALMPSLSQKIVCVPSERVAVYIERLGFIPHIIKARGPQHASIVEALIPLARQLNSGI